MSWEPTAGFNRAAFGSELRPSDAADQIPPMDPDFAGGDAGVAGDGSIGTRSKYSKHGTDEERYKLDTEPLSHAPR